MARQFARKSCKDAAYLNGTYAYLLREVAKAAHPCAYSYVRVIYTFMYKIYCTFELDRKKEPDLAGLV